MERLRTVFRRRGAWVGAVAVTALVSAGAVVAVVEGDRSDRAETSGSSGSFPAVGAEAGDAPAGPEAREATAVVPAGGPRVVRTASLRVEVDGGEFGGAFEKAQALAAANGGFVASSSTSSGGFKGAAGTRDDGSEDRPQAGELTLRVPADRLDVVRRALGEMGTVEAESVQGDDVTAQLVDYEARLKSLSVEEEALRTLMGRATGVGEVLSVQGRLFEVRQQVEQLQAQRDQLDRAATLATVTVSLFEPGALAGGNDEAVTGLARSLRQAVRGAVAVVGGMIVVVGWLTPVALLALGGWAVARLRRRSSTAVGPGGPGEPLTAPN